MTQVIEDFVPEARIQQVKYSVLNPSHIKVNTANSPIGITHPVALDSRINELFLITRIQISQVVPTRARPLRHRIELALVGGLAVPKIVSRCHPLTGTAERRFRFGIFI